MKKGKLTRLKIQQRLCSEGRRISPQLQLFLWRCYSAGSICLWQTQLRPPLKNTKHEQSELVTSELPSCCHVICMKNSKLTRLFFIFFSFKIVIKYISPGVYLVFDSGNGNSNSNNGHFQGIRICIDLEKLSVFLKLLNNE